MLRMFAGAALPIGQYRGILTMAALLAGFIWKSRREWTLLARQVGDAFEERRR
jgi:hypothetical protein